MIQVRLRACLQLLVIASATSRVEATDYYLAPTGTAQGPGSLAAPYDLVTALSGQVGQPGDTFWLRGGDYKLGHLNTQIQGAPGMPITFRQVAGERARIDGSLSIFNSHGYLVFRDFELYSSDTNRVSSQTNAGFNVTDIAILPGFDCYAPNLSFINLVVHDETRHGLYLFAASTNTLVYGCLLFNNGWRSPDNAEGHGVYVQGKDGSKIIADNVIFNQSGANVHVYDNTVGNRLVGITLDGNVAFNAGAIQQVRSYRDWIVGVDAPALYADGIVMKDNMGYLTPGLPVLPALQIGRDGTNGTVLLTNNYMPLSLLMNNWLNAGVSGNFFAPRLSNFVIALNQSSGAAGADWTRNTYVCAPDGNQAFLNSKLYSFSDWQEATGFDRDSTFLEGNLHGTRVFVRPNRYEPGRANIIVYNWDNLENVTVDVSSVLSPGAGYELRNAEDFFAAPVLSGIYDGQPLLLPMTNLTVAVPNGPMITAPPTGPTFNVFVLLSRTNPLQINLLGDSVQVSWPIGWSAGALETTQNPASPEDWAASTADPALAGDRFMVTEPIGSGAKFYRLQLR